MIPQFSLEKLKNNFTYQNIYSGLLLFILGLFKKIMIADPLSLYATQGFDQAPPEQSMFNTSMLMEKYKVYLIEIPFLQSDWYFYLSLGIAVVLAVFLTLTNTGNLVKKLEPKSSTFIVTILLTILLVMNLNKATEFLYFNF